MQLIKQPKGTGNCGQCVMAMLSNNTLETAISLMGEGRTSIDSLKTALSEYKLSFIRHLFVKSEEEIPDRPGAILIDVKNLSTNKIFKHWIAWDGKEIFDPKFGCRKELNRVPSEIIENAIFFEVTHE